MAPSRPERGPLRALVGILLLTAVSATAADDAGGAAATAADTTAADTTAADTTAAPSTPEEIFDAKFQRIRELIYTGSSEEAESLSRQGFDEAEAEWGEDALEAARFLDAVLLSRMANGKYHGEEGDETVAIGEHAVEIRENNPDAEPADLAWALRSLSDLRRRRDENETALQLVTRAIDVLREADGMETTLGARLLNLQGLCERRLGNLELARDLFAESAALHLAVSGEDSVFRDSTLTNLAGSLQRMGDLSAALAVYREAADISERVHGPDHLQTGLLLRNFSVALSENGDLDEARRTAERSLAIMEKTLRPDHPYLGETLEMVAVYCNDLGDVEVALELGRRALEIAEANDPGSSRVVRILTNLATFAERGGQPDLAAEYYQRGVAVVEALEDPQPKAPSELNRLYGEFLREQGRGEEAEQRFLVAIAWAEKDPRLRYVSRAPSVRDLGELYVERGKFAEAMPYLEEAFADLRASMGDSHPNIASVLYTIGLAEQGLGRREAAMASAVASNEIQRRHLLDTVNALPETMALRYVSRRAPSMDLALSLLIEDPTQEAADAVWEIIVQRALVLDELARRNRVFVATGDPELAEKVERYRSTRERLAHRTLADPESTTPEEHLAELAALEREKNEAERDLAEAGLGRRVAGDVVAGSDVRNALPRGSALVSFVRYDVHREGRRGDAAYAALVSHGGDPACKVVDLGEAREVEASVSGWWTSVAWGGRGTRGIVQIGAQAETRLQDYRTAGRDLRRRVWDPVAPSLENAERVFLVPDGDLLQVSFAALPNDDETYLLETAPVLHLLSAERSLVREREAGGGTRGLLAIGGPDFGGNPEDADPPPSDTDGQSLRADFASLEFTVLEGSRQEAMDVAEVWVGANGPEAEDELLLLTGAAADESAFRSGVAGRSVLHLATHGFFLGRSAADAAPQGTRAPRALDRTEPELMQENPLLLSGLALAGANLRLEQERPGDEDGLVTAEEIAALDLAGVEWAVLSACETGAGTVRTGEGVFGLRRAFEIAGAGTVVMSLWSVDDEATRDWMAALYRARFVDGLETDEAVREASRKLLRELRDAGEPDHPFRWAAFVAVGDWR